jgi:hypothetical protein
MPHADRSTNRTNGIPKWFNVQNYATVAKLDNLGWYEQLVARVECARIVEHMEPSGLHVLVSPEEVQQVANHLLVVKENPLLARGELAKLMNGELAAFANSEELVPPIIHELSLREFYALEGQILPEHRLPLRKFADRQSAAKLCPWPNDVPPADSSVSDYFGEGAPPILAVDIRLPSTKLRSQFETWLSSARAAQKSKLERRIGSPRDWTKQGLLPRMDIELWLRSLPTEQHPTTTTLAFTLFGDGSKDSTVETTTQLVRSILNREERGTEFMQVLKARAALDIYERSQGLAHKQRREGGLKKVC